MNLIGKEYKVKLTTDYSKFAKLPMNRDIDSKHVQKMIASVREMGVIRPVITTTTTLIEGIKRMYVIDGQHLTTALERENLPVPYVEIEVKSEEDLIEKMAMLNNSSKSWDMMNYINAWRMIRPDYAKLFKWKNMYDLEPLMIAAIAVNKASDIRHGSQNIKLGKFVITNPKGEEMCKEFNDIFLKIGMVDRSVKFQFLLGYLQSHGKISHAKVLANIEANIKLVKTMANTEETGAYIRSKIFNIK